jgi:thymidylate synthase (FAD)
MNTAKIIAVTQPYIRAEQDSGDMTTLTVEEFIAYVARVSNPSNQSNTLTSNKLLRYLVKNKHWSPFEMVNIVMEIVTTRDIARQILRHRSFSFQEFCLSGDTEIYFAVPKNIRKGSYKPTHKIKLKDLWDKWENGAAPIKGKHGNEIRIPLKDRLKSMYIKCYDETTGQLTTAHIKEVFKTGVKPLFEITLDDGKKIKTTKEHKFLTKEGFKSLEDITGLVVENNRAMMTIKSPLVGVNGIPLYQSKDWLTDIKNKSIFENGGIQWIVDTYGFNYNTIRKWVRIHGLQYTKQEVNVIAPVWNKGKYGYKTKSRSIESRRKSQQSALARGENHNWYRGGNSKRREPLDSIAVREFRREHQDTCSLCGTNEGKIDLHHIIPVSVDPTKNNDTANWQLLCRSCHIEHHKKEDYTGWQSMGAKNRKQSAYTIEWQTIKSIEYVGNEDTYDLEIDHHSHNYIANGIVVHNSQRYADPTKDLGFVTRDARLQDPKNRQNSIEGVPDEIRDTWIISQDKVLDMSRRAYEWAISQGIAKEQARAVLPEGLTSSRMYMNGTLRSWIHYCQLRMGNGTQKEHRLIASEAWNQLLFMFPSLREIEIE